MYTEPCSSKNISFGSTVFVTSSAGKLMSRYSPSRKGQMTKIIKRLEGNGNNDVVVIDSCDNVRDAYMTVYNMVKGKLCRGKFPTRFPLTKEFDSYYRRESDLSSMVPVKKSFLDKYNPLWDAIINALKQTNS